MCVRMYVYSSHAYSHTYTCKDNFKKFEDYCIHVCVCVFVCVCVCMCVCVFIYLHITVNLFMYEVNLVVAARIWAIRNESCTNMSCRAATIGRLSKLSGVLYQKLWLFYKRAILWRGSFARKTWKSRKPTWRCPPIPSPQQIDSTFVNTCVPQTKPHRFTIFREGISL